jgi:hypothetical protein
MRTATLAALAAFAAAMALVEAAIVVYLRELYYPEDPRALFPLRLLSDAHLALELAREVATLVMLGAVAWLSRRAWLARFAAFLFLFGLWDLCYYAWLWLYLGWPVSWGEWDVLFLIPWPWLAPWPAPAAIAALFGAWGGAVLWRGQEHRPSAAALALFGVGVLLALGAFLAPGAALLAGGAAAFRGWTPGPFPWWPYGSGLAALAAGLMLALRGAARAPASRRFAPTAKGEDG